MLVETKSAPPLVYYYITEFVTAWNCELDPLLHAPVFEIMPQMWLKKKGRGTEERSRDWATPGSWRAFR